MPKRLILSEIINLYSGRCYSLMAWKTGDFIPSMGSYAPSYYLLLTRIFCHKDRNPLRDKSRRNINIREIIINNSVSIYWF